MDPLIDGNAIVSILVDSTTDYLVVFAPVFLLIAGILLAYFISILLLNYFYPGRFDRNEEE